MTTPPEPSQLETELLQIREENGGILTAAAIISAAAAQDHPLHGRFEWRDDIAARRYRLQQARHLVRVVREQYIDKRGEPRQIRVFHSVPLAGSPTGRAYVPLEEIKRNEMMSAQVKRQMEVDWRNLRRRYEQFSDFITMVRRTMDEEDLAAEEPLALGDEG
jgi:hypothetical protein